MVLCLVPSCSFLIHACTNSAPKPKPLSCWSNPSKYTQDLPYGQSATKELSLSNDGRGYETYPFQRSWWECDTSHDPPITLASIETAATSTTDVPPAPTKPTKTATTTGAESLSSQYFSN